MASWQKDEDDFEYGEIDVDSIPKGRTPASSNFFRGSGERGGGNGDVQRSGFDRLGAGVRGGRGAGGRGAARGRGGVKKPAYSPPLMNDGEILQGKKGSVDWISPKAATKNQREKKDSDEADGGGPKKKKYRGSINNPRDVAYNVLNTREEAGGGFVERVLDQILFSRNCEMAASDRALCREIVYGVITWRDTLDWLAQRKQKSSKKLEPEITVLLRIGLYQLLWLDRVPDHAAVHETVQLAKRMGLIRQSGFVNALLRGYERERESALEAIRDLQRSDPAKGWSHPQWLYQRWKREWGQEQASKLMELNNMPSSNFGRVNKLKGSSAELVGIWDDEHVLHENVLVEWAQDGDLFQLQSGLFFPKLRSFQDGLFYIQDPSTLLSVHMMNPQPGDRVWDMCAAPGGKTGLIAQAMQNKGEILCSDLDEERLKLVLENCARLGVTCARTELAETLSKSPPKLAFDKVLIDAPCSNTGVMRRRIDLRWRISQDEVDRLRDTQMGLLKLASGAIKNGGLLVYSTCSIERRENKDLVDDFLQSESGQAFTLEAHRQLLPFADDTDGAFVAVMRKDKHN